MEFTLNRQDEHRGSGRVARERHQPVANFWNVSSRIEQDSAITSVNFSRSFTAWFCWAEPTKSPELQNQHIRNIESATFMPQGRKSSASCTIHYSICSDSPKSQPRAAGDKKSSHLTRHQPSACGRLADKLCDYGPIRSLVALTTGLFRCVVPH